MRYYHFSLGINAQAIRENEELGRHWNSYEETLEVINEYMTKNLRNHLSFLAYREEEKSIPAVFAYDEKKLSYQEAISSSWMTISAFTVDEREALKK